MKWIEWNEISGFRIGHSQDKEGGTGCTVILCPQGATAGVEVRGGGPATRETDLLNPKNMVQKIHAVTLSGGSAFGLEAGSGVMQYLSEHQIGFDMKGIYIPIVCQASLFDCGLGNPKAYPDKAMGYQACVNSESIDLSQGNIGAGMGASVGKAFGFEKAMKTGLGHACVQVDQLKVGAIVALNACGDIYQANSTKWLAGAYDRKKRKPIYTVDALIDGMENQSNAHENTTIGCIFTNADLNKAQMNKVASLSHNAYAHCIHPVATSNDGDTIFAMATNEVVADMDLVGLLAIKAMEKAIEKAALYANAAYDLFSASDV
ncbi:P1 family peptidase [Absicoccus intestinalis]|uniref:P1 family peptidase n=1 Tax=Absicoccus intestinalis TaxID=2926319 RepID=A0ABU4WIB8_9FIRM|nr:P1 family peptidase [Absicoccus sp. CLA-KB-P134]MDX8416301.1 P1 family peptidase [Absicoccus sp. CLA-KB-P134]